MMYFTYLESRSKFFKITFGFFLIALVGLVDHFNGYELGFSLFYLIPVSLFAWLLGKKWGIFSSIVSALVWIEADISEGHPYSSMFVPIWNTVIRFSFYVIIIFLLTELKKMLEREKKFSRIDNLTGAINTRGFYEQIQMEVDRFERTSRPFTLAYMDLDNFKMVNDKHGHTMGDKALQSVVSTAQKNLRKLDLVVRLGGDEFAFLLPECNVEASKIAITNLQKKLLEEMLKNDWPITFSIGVLTCVKQPSSIEEIIKRADQLMYTVKQSNKNAIKFETFNG